jgi:hypothetical protein
MGWIKTLFGAVTGNVRLIVEYALIAIIIAVAAVAFTLWTQTHELNAKNDTLLGRVSQVEIINQAQDATINDLQDLRKKDAEVMAGLVTDFKQLSQNDSAARKKLSELEKSNAKVRDYLDQPLPAELVCLLNESCQTRNPDPNRKGQAPVVPAGAVSGAKKAPDAKGP